MRNYFTLAALLALALAPAAARAQTSVTADRIYLGSTGCAMRTGAGAPTGGTSCDVYFDTATGHVWVNHGGTWIDASTRTPTFTTVTATTKLTTPLVDTAAGNLQLAPAGDLVLAPAGRDVLPAGNYTVNLGALEDKYLTLHAAELWVETLVAQRTMATIGGRVLVAPTNILAADLAAAATSLTVKYNNFLNGDIVYMESNGRVEFMSVTSAASGSAGAYVYTVARNLDGSGADTWNAGDGLLDTGQVGSGFIDLYSVAGVLSGAGPTIVGNVRTGTAYNAIAPRFAVGNLNGLYGHSGDQYGFAAGNPLGAYVFLDDTSGLVMGGPGGPSVHITPAGAATFAGTVTAGAGAIGGWSIGGDYLRDAGDSTGLASTVTGANDVRFYAGASFANRGTAPFRVYEDGSAVMSSVLVTAPNAGAGGSALNADADTRDINLWRCGGSCAITPIADGKVGTTSLRSGAGGADLVETRRIPFDANKQYRFHVWARAGGGADGVLYAGLSAFDASGAECDTAGCPSSGGARYAYCAANVPAASLAAWTEYVCTYGAGSGHPILPAMRTVAPSVYLNISGSGTGWMEIQDIRLEEMSPGTLIKDGAITTAKITAGAVTVGQVNATGYGDNVIKNGAFEVNVGENLGGGAASSGLAGWERAADSNAPFGLVNSCCGLLGPGTLLLDQPAAGNYLGATYLAVPLEITNGAAVGVSYRISARVYSGAATPSLYVFALEYSGAQGGVRRVVRAAGASLPDVSSTNDAVVASCAPLVLGWNTIEYLYTPTAGTRWMSLSLYNGSAICSGGTPTVMHIDDVEMQKQIGTGHISANAITANLIRAGAITTDKLDALAVTTPKIDAGAISADKIQAGAIDATKIQAGSIDASKMNVTALSAITANLGNVTAGSMNAVAITGGTIDGTTIRGVNISASSNISGATITGGSITSGTSITGVSIDGSTITAGAGSVVLNASGITVGNGDSNGNARIKLGPSELWGGSFGLSTSGGMNAGGLDVTGTSHLRGGVTTDAGMNIAGVLTVSNYASINGNVQFQGDQQTNYWPNGFPPTGAGGQMGFVNGCRCLAMLSSSVRFKENLRAWSAPDPLAILALPLYRFDFKNAPGVIPSKDHVGFTVEDLVKIAPDAVTRDDAGRPLSFYSDTLDTYLLAALKAINGRVSRMDALTARTSSVDLLTSRIAALEKRIAQLEAAAKKKD